MDIIEFWRKQVSKWDEDKRGGFCWNFGFPSTEGHPDSQEANEDKKSCVHVFLQHLTFNESVSYNSKTGFSNGKSCKWGFKIWFVKQDLSGKEVQRIGYLPMEQSYWDNIYKPLQECCGFNTILNDFELMGLPIKLKKWEGRTVVNYGSTNYHGWQVEAIFKIIL